MATHRVFVAYRDLDAASGKIECLERRLRRTADWHVPGARVQFMIRSETIETAMEAVADALEECDEEQDLTLPDPR
jgi:hypothetical protein